MSRDDSAICRTEGHVHALGATRCLVCGAEILARPTEAVRPFAHRARPVEPPPEVDVAIRACEDEPPSGERYAFVARFLGPRPRARELALRVFREAVVDGGGAASVVIPRAEAAPVSVYFGRPERADVEDLVARAIGGRP